ncbi:hypothetical protein LWC34_26650 [Kibdelosporangium philippinense]|uniref:Uncharacterized protein n=1 Tax=Kibdelosporangium philippinense TaxID=211113 RepID=A0ABS8ZIC1_9PSEU|nr:hypothetical protein [Kibdelosporangium philippinense]MCE7006386.1 hypothetical protein [Kibdelosporangium philippinense]
MFSMFGAVVCGWGVPSDVGLASTMPGVSVFGAMPLSSCAPGFWVAAVVTVLVSGAVAGRGPVVVSGFGVEADSAVAVAACGVADALDCSCWAVTSDWPSCLSSTDSWSLSPDVSTSTSVAVSLSPTTRVAMPSSTSPTSVLASPSSTSDTRWSVAAGTRTTSCPDRPSSPGRPSGPDPVVPRLTGLCTDEPCDTVGTGPRATGPVCSAVAGDCTPAGPLPDAPVTALDPAFTAGPSPDTPGPPLTALGPPSDPPGSLDEPLSSPAPTVPPRPPDDTAGPTGPEPPLDPPGPPGPPLDRVAGPLTGPPTTPLGPPDGALGPDDPFVPPDGPTDGATGPPPGAGGASGPEPGEAGGGVTG